MSQIVIDARKLAKSKYFKEINELSSYELHDVISCSIMAYIAEDWKKSKDLRIKNRTAFYLSAEFLVGRAIYNNLISKELYDETEEELNKYGVSLKALEDVEDAALGNGGLGRLAACFLDSAATHNIPLDGYGIRYKYGLFKQDFVNGFQIETADDWTKWGDPWSVRCENDTVTVDFRDMSVKAVPYDMPIVGYNNNIVNTLRIWDAKAITEFHLDHFDRGEYQKAIEQGYEMLDKASEF